MLEYPTRTEIGHTPPVADGVEASATPRTAGWTLSMRLLQQLGELPLPRLEGLDIVSEIEIE